jgi:hypothetical protein
MDISPKMLHDRDVKKRAGKRFLIFSSQLCSKVAQLRGDSGRFPVQNTLTLRIHFQGRKNCVHFSAVRYLPCGISRQCFCATPQKKI